MQAVILAAGRGTRMNELTKEVPKPMLSVLGKSLIAHKLDALPEDIEEVIIVVGYQGDVIRKAFGDSYEGKKIKYVEQEVLDGTGGALGRAAPHLTGRFVVMMGDDIYGANDVARIAAAPDWALLVEETQSMASGGRMLMDAQGSITGIEEGDHRGKPGAMCTNLFVLDTRLFTHPLVPKSAGSSEYGLPQTVLAASKTFRMPFVAIPSESWIQITSPEDIAKAEARLAGL
jgi:NDP-sugar pyrophosphorylase family protein